MPRLARRAEVRRLRFLVEEGSLSSARPGAKLVLPEAESRHLRTSLRATPGLEIHLFDGKGCEWRAAVASVSARGVEAVLREPDPTRVEPILRVVLFQALSRDSIFDEVVDQATALGIAEIVPLLVERSQHAARRPDAARLHRWTRIAREAAKLSWRRIVPRIAPAITVAELAPLDPMRTIGLLLDTGAGEGSLRSLLGREPPETVSLGVGPEGGFAPSERQRLVEAGFEPVSLGPRVLRTQHAGPAALAIILARWGDLG